MAAHSVSAGQEIEPSRIGKEVNICLACYGKQAILDRFCFGLRLTQAPNEPAGYHSGYGTCRAKTISYQDISSHYFVRVISYHFSGHLVLFFIKGFNSLMLFFYVSKFISCPVFMIDTDM